MRNTSSNKRFGCATKRDFLSCWWKDDGTI